MVSEPGSAATSSALEASWDLPYHMIILQATVLLALYFLSTLVSPDLLVPKRRAYIMCLYVSATCSMSSMLYMPHLASKGFDLGFFMSDDELSKFVCLSFITYLFLDLLVGVFHYPKYLELITSWIHHPTYMLILGYAYFTGTTRMFMVALPLEIPTVVLSVGSMWPHLRSDNLFGITFLAFRICYHVFCLLNLYSGGAPAWMYQTCALALVPHCHWFYKWVSKYWLLANRQKQV